MKKIVNSLTLILFLIINQISFSQTNISGGIFTNTTWNLANSPYIITDTTVVFPNVTLTIDPGVIVKFNQNKRLIIRQGKLIANGNATDSIIFTSNSASTLAGFWSDIYINGGSLISEFNYCKIQFATVGIFNHYLNGVQNTTSTLKILNTKFHDNLTGVSTVGNSGGYSEIDSCSFYNNNEAIYGSNNLINNSNIYNNNIGLMIMPFTNRTYINKTTINSNNFGITGGASYGAAFYSIKNSIISCNARGIVLGGYPSYTDTILNSVLNDNNVAILDTSGSGVFMKNNIIENNLIGLKLKGSNKSIHCNKICNTIWDVYCINVFANNLDMSNNFWCNNTPTSINSKIYDGYDNFNLSLINYTPVDNSNCYSTAVINPTYSGQCQTSTNLINTMYEELVYEVYPNPITDYSSLTFKNNSYKSHDLIIYNCLGELVMSINSNNSDSFLIHKSNLANGIYYFKLMSNNINVGHGKFLIQ